MWVKGRCGLGLRDLDVRWGEGMMGEMEKFRSECVGESALAFLKK